MKRTKLLLALPFAITLLAGCGSNGPSDAKLSSIQINGNLAKTTYETTDSWSTEGLYVTAEYSDNSTKTLASDKYTFSFDPATPQQDTHYLKVKATSTENAQIVSPQAAFLVTVNKPSGPEISKLSLKGSLSKTVYNVGDEWDSAGLSVDAIYSDGTQKALSSGYTFEFDPPAAQAGLESVSVRAKLSSTPSVVSSYQQFSVTVNAPVSEDKMKMSVFADVQLCYKKASTASDDHKFSANLGSTANAPLALHNHFQFCKDNEVDVIFMNGDIVNNCIPEYYNYFEEIFEGVYGTDPSQYPEIIWNMGNHEWWDINEKHTENAVKTFKERTGFDNDDKIVKKSAVKYHYNYDGIIIDTNDTYPTYYKVVDGVPFLIISGENSAGDIGTEMKAEIESWLMEIAELEWVQNGGPIYVGYHYALNTSMTNGQGKGKNADVIDEIFANYPQAIIYTGDTHFSGINERAIHQKDYTTINLGTSSYSRAVKDNALGEEFYNISGSSKAKDIASGNAAWMSEYTPTIHLVNTKENGNMVESRYFSSDGGEEAIKINGDWEIYHSKNKNLYTYTSERFSNKAASKKLYGAEGLSWDNSAEVKYAVNNGQMTVVFPDVNDYHYCESYRITVTGNTSKSYNLISTYATYNENPEYNYYVLEDLPAGENYSVKVEAYDYYCNVSLNSLTTAVESPEVGIDPIDNKATETYSDISKRVNINENNSSNSSIEYYYRGIQPYSNGAMLNRIICNESGNTDMSEYLSYGKDTKLKSPILTVDVKNLSDSAIEIGLVVVNSDGQWLTDFTEKYRKEVTTNNWETLEWDLNDLFGFNKLSDIKNLYLKASSKNPVDTGYEMSLLLDNIDVYEGNDVQRGLTFKAGEHFTKEFATKYDATVAIFTVDIKITSPGSMDIMFGNRSNWNKYYGNYTLTGSTTDEYEGVTVSTTEDGYTRYEFRIASLTKFIGGHQKEIDLVHMNGNKLSASGYIDISVSNAETPIPIPEDYRGEAFAANEDLTLKFEEFDSTLAIVTFDVKFTKAGYLHVMFGNQKDWDIYYGYYQLNGSTTQSFDGVTVSTTEDGYTRYEFRIAQLTVTSGKHAKNIDMIYIRGKGGFTTGSGYVDASIKNAETPIPLPEEHRGYAFKAGADCSISLKEIHDATKDTLVIDLKLTGTGKAAIMIANNSDWHNYFGYFDLTGATTDNYEGVTISTTEDGYTRYEFKMSELKKVEGTRPTTFDLVYVRGGWTTASGYIDVSVK